MNKITKLCSSLDYVQEALREPLPFDCSTKFNLYKKEPEITKKDLFHQLIPETIEQIKGGCSKMKNYIINSFPIRAGGQEEEYKKYKGGKMLSDIPKNLEKVSKENIDKQIIRTGMIAELDAVSLYEQLASMTRDEKLKKVLLDIAKEEKTHIAEFETLLFQRDKEQVEETEKARREVEEITK